MLQEGRTKEKIKHVLHTTRFGVLILRTAGVRLCCAVVDKHGSFSSSLVNFLWAGNVVAQLSVGPRVQSLLLARASSSRRKGSFLCQVALCAYSAFGAAYCFTVLISMLNPTHNSQQQKIVKMKFCNKKCDFVLIW